MLLLAALAVYTFCFPLAGKVKSFTPPVSEGYTGDFAENDALSDIEYIDLGGYCRPETIIERDGYLYASVHGKIIRTKFRGNPVEVVVDSPEGETLGFDFDADGNIIFTDPRYGGTTPGIYKADISAEDTVITPLCTEVDGKALTCPDAVTVSSDGIIYFSDATEYSPVDYNNANLAFQYESYYHSSNGRVCAYNPATDESWTVAGGFSGANGVALSFDEKYLYLCETMEYSIWRIPVDIRNGVKGDGAELFLSNLPGYVDNLNRGLYGRYWVGLVSPRTPSWDDMLPSVFLRKIFLRYNEIADTGAQELMPETGVGAVFSFDDKGEILEFYMSGDTEYHNITGAYETYTDLFLHSNNYTGKIGYIKRDYKE